MDEQYRYTGKYQCNHPESDFVDNSTGPIEMKKENFVEYTYRNEKERLQEAWKESVSSNYGTNKYSLNNYGSSSYNSNSNYRANNTAYNSQNTNYYSQRNAYNKTTNKKSLKLPIIIIILIYFLPILFEILEDLF